MIELYSFGTGNGRRASIALEECGLPYVAHKVDIARGEHKAPAFLAINPVGRIPVIVDPDGPSGSTITINDSGAILLYCAEKSGRFIPSDPVRRMAALRWTFHAESDAGEPIAGLFRLSRLPDLPDSVPTFLRARLRGFLGEADAHLAEREYLADELSIADLAYYTVAEYGHSTMGLDDLPHLRRWFTTMSARPGVARGMAVPD